MKFKDLFIPLALLLAEIEKQAQEAKIFTDEKESS